VEVTSFRCCTGRSVPPAHRAEGSDDRQAPGRHRDSPDCSEARLCCPVSGQCRNHGKTHAPVSEGISFTPHWPLITSSNQAGLYCDGWLLGRRVAQHGEGPWAICGQAQVPGH
jgi:hypothetical protein